MNRLIKGCIAGILFLILLGAPVYAESIDMDFNTMFQDHGSVMLIIDPATGEILFANEAAVKFYGYEEKVLHSMFITEINTLTPAETAEEMALAVSENRNFFVFRHRTASGAIKTVEVYSYPFEYQGRALLYSIIQDITPRVLLEQSNQRMRLAIYGIGIALLAVIAFYANRWRRQTKILQEKTFALENFNQLRKDFINADHRLIYLKDEHLNYLFVNKAMESFYHLPEEAFVGKDDFALTGKEFAQLRKTTDDIVLEHGIAHVQNVEWDNRIYRVN